MKMKNFFYFLLFLVAVVILAGTVIGRLPVGIMPEKYLMIINLYVLPYAGIGMSAIFGMIFLFGKNPLKMILLFLHLILVAAVVVFVFFPDIATKIIALF